ncbi:MAG: helix-turn-helix domain-containing protein [Alphaproteobacteria bacterium]|nr:helix-turn-helix domain-containing protein [Alphaproteobacteria bacterium]
MSTHASTAGRTLHRVVAILGLMDDGVARRVTDVQRATGLPYATTHRMLAALATEGVLMALGRDGYVRRRLRA